MISDDVTDYLKRIEVFRGSLRNVYGRFCKAIQYYQPDWIMRLSADSPFIPSLLIDEIANIPRESVDIVTNIFPRSFPKGHSVEILRSKIMIEAQPRIFLRKDKEHVTSYFYRNAAPIKLLMLEEKMPAPSWAIDTAEFYKRLINTNGKVIKYNPQE